MGRRHGRKYQKPFTSPYAGAAPPCNRITEVFWMGQRWLRIEPPWIKGYRPAMTYRRIG